MGDPQYWQALASTAAELIAFTGGQVLLRVWTGSGGATGDMFALTRSEVTGTDRTFLADIGEAQLPRYNVQDGMQSANRSGQALILVSGSGYGVEELAAAFSLNLGHSALAACYRPEVLINGVVVTVEAVVADRLAQTLAISYAAPLGTV